MEENQTPEEKSETLPPEEGASEALAPEEILERAKKENEKLGDERQRDRLQWGNYAGFIATILSCAVVMIVKIALEKVVPTELMATLFTGIAAQNIVQACVCTKKMRVLYSVTAALITAGTVMYWVMWILELCGVSI